MVLAEACQRLDLQCGLSLIEVESVLSGLDESFERLRVMQHGDGIVIPENEIDAFSMFRELGDQLKQIGAPR